MRMLEKSSQITKSAENSLQTSISTHPKLSSKNPLASKIPRKIPPIPKKSLKTPPVRKTPDFREFGQIFGILIFVCNFPIFMSCLPLLFCKEKLLVGLSSQMK